jgi:hypothetical protein
MDLFSRRIVGWSLRQQITGEIGIDALRQAWFAGQGIRGGFVLLSGVICTRDKLPAQKGAFQHPFKPMKTGCRIRQPEVAQKQWVWRTGFQ